MSIISWFVPNIGPIIKDAIKETMKDEIDTLRSDLKDELDAQIKPIEQSLSRVEGNFTGILDEISAAEKNVLGSFTVVTQPLQRIQDFMNKFPF